jgi:hypothetical protein
MILASTLSSVDLRKPIKWFTTIENFGIDMRKNFKTFEKNRTKITNEIFIIFQRAL